MIFTASPAGVIARIKPMQSRTPAVQEFAITEVYFFE